MLRHVHAIAGGTMIGAREFMSVLAAHQANALEEAFLALVDGALDRDRVVIDNFHLIKAVVNACDYTRALTCWRSPLPPCSTAPPRVTSEYVLATNEERAPQPIDSRAYQVELGSFGPGNYECLCQPSLDYAAAGRFNYAEIHRFAPDLNAHQISNSCAWVKQNSAVETARFIEYLAAQNLTSNVEPEPTAARRLERPQGFRRTSFTRWRPRSRCLLKIGRWRRGSSLSPSAACCWPASQHRQDHHRPRAGGPAEGQVLPDRRHRDRRHRQLLHPRAPDLQRRRKHNAPSVVFIDDGDLIFENSDGQGFHRYLLTMLNELESASAERTAWWFSPPWT